MSDSDDEPYSTIFTSLKHPVRRKVLRMLSEKPRSFSEMLGAFKVSSSHLTYHLENLGELVSKTDDGKYKLSAFGEAAVATMSKVEETPKATQPERLSALSMNWKYLLVALLIGLVILAGISIVQYQSLNRVSGEYGRLEDVVELVKKGASLQTEYDLRCGLVFGKINDSTIIVLDGTNGSAIPCTLLGPSCCAVYSPYDRCTLDLFFSVHSVSSGSYASLTVQSGNVFDLRTDETAPVIWSVNATVTGMYSISLVSSGWYTISLCGPVTSTYPSAIRLVEGDFSASLIMIHEGTVSPFIVTTSALP